MKKILFVESLSLFVFSGCLNYQCWAADEESLGQQAEQAGKLREAVTHYVSALQSTPEGGAKDQQLREKIIKLVQKLTPPPAVPEEVIKYEGRAEAAFKSAKSRGELLDAAKEYSKALRLAPWIGINYFNLGIVLEKVGDYSGAIRNFIFYLLATPNAQDSVDVKKKIAGLEYTVEKAARDQQMEVQQRLAKQREEEKQKEVYRGIAGRWVNEGGYSWYRIDVSGNKVEIFLVEYCAFGDCNQKRTTNRKDFGGTIDGDQLVGYALNLPELPFEFQGRKCLKPGGDFPRKGTISSDGRKIIWKAAERPVYGGCSDPMSKGLETWIRE